MERLLLVGLGNPGAEYENTRHNMGFWFLDEIALWKGLRFTLERGFFGAVAKGSLEGCSLILLKPTTYMNLSGKAVRAMCQFYKLAPEEVLVVHDELDLPAGEAKLKKGGGHAGHNGLKDIQAQLGSPNFWRLRLGIDHPRALGWTQPVRDYVLHPPRKEEGAAIEAMMIRASRALEAFVQDDLDRAHRLLRTS